MSYGPTEQRPSEQWPTEQRPTDQWPTGQRPTEQAWEQPSFTGRDPQPVVWGEVIVPGESRLVLAPLTPHERQLVTLRRLIFPVALLVAVLTGSWFTVLVLALVVNFILRRQLALSRHQRVRITLTLR